MAVFKFLIENLDIVNIKTKGLKYNYISVLNITELFHV